jgi:hypothetical protein
MCLLFNDTFLTTNNHHGLIRLGHFLQCFDFKNDGLNLNLCHSNLVGGFSKLWIFESLHRFRVCHHGSEKPFLQPFHQGTIFGNHFGKYRKENCLRQPSFSNRRHDARRRHEDHLADRIRVVLGDTTSCQNSAHRISDQMHASIISVKI